MVQSATGVVKKGSRVKQRTGPGVGSEFVLDYCVLCPTLNLAYPAPSHIDATAAGERESRRAGEREMQVDGSRVISAPVDVDGGGYKY